MGIPEICITFIAALVGVAYPILLEVVSRLDEKYGSLVIVNLFKEEIEWKLFRLMLFTSLFCVLVYIVLNVPYLAITTNICFTNMFISAFIISTTVLIIVFLFFVKKIIIYYSTNQVLQYFNQQKDNEDHIYFQATSDILNLSIKKQDTVTAKTASEFIYKNFRNIRVLNSGIQVQYPNAYYQAVHKIIQELIYSRDERFIYLEHRTIGGVWYLGEHERAKIHEDTFGWLWHGLVLAVKHDRDDMVMHYWSVAHQYFMYELSSIHPNHVRMNEQFVVQNAQEVDDREEERSRFLEFNYALGGLLMYRGRHKCLKRIFEYTTSLPPSYDLLPLWMNEVFQLYFKFRDPYDYNFPFINNRYYFPEVEGIQGENAVKFWICKYAALLFIRQYSIIPYLSFMEPLRYPFIPEKQNEKRLWIENLDHFKTLIENILNDGALLNDVGFGYINSQWFIDEGKTSPQDFIENLKQEVSQAYDNTELNQPISDAKRQSFIDGTKNILSKVINEYKSKLNSEIEEEYKSWFVPSINMVSEKSAFSDNQDVHHTNYDTFLAAEQANRISMSVSETFHLKYTERFLLKTPDLFKALDRLALDPKKFVIVNFGIELNYQINYEKIDGLTATQYKSLEIITFDNFNRAMMNPTFFVLEKRHLPALVCKQIAQDQLQKYSLTEIDEELHIYASVIDLNLNDDLRNELEAEDIYPNLRKSALLYIGTPIEIRWAKNIKMLALSQFSEFRNRGVANDAGDVTFKEE
ncbi:hypothetical protein [Pedobacter chitinilyticus]|uniref:Uncharacterized protein n=1 Tax=Pedobacter chitinilyticus TaxID=2233776 RepID=A0A443YMR7_9SPHI|nr:hypothetical protein [Pedobacter chitinilyticus]RWU05057.1 hypothetical protein DPV69_18010 [Pedobacter chitinilyticus]